MFGTEGFCRCTSQVGNERQGGNTDDFRLDSSMHLQMPYIDPALSLGVIKVERRSQDGLKGRFKQFKVAGSSTDTCELPCSLFKKKVTTVRCIGHTSTGMFLTGFKLIVS